MKIPKIIHQTWSTESIPDEFQLLSDTWKELHPSWEYILWTDKMNRDFIIQHFPDFLGKYDAYPDNIQRVDAVRYFILYHYGGVYIDLDFECLENIEPLLEEATCLFGKEPDEHCRVHNKKVIISNAFMACIPRHVFIRSLCEEISLASSAMAFQKDYIQETTGLFMVSRMYDLFADKHLIYILNSELLFPLTKEEIPLAISQETPPPEIQKKIDNAYAVHYYWETWRKRKSTKIPFLKPISIKNKIRIGRNHDGGYVLFERLLYEADILISYGVGWETSFEEHFNQITGKEVLMFDPTMYGRYMVNFIYLKRLLINLRLNRAYHYLKRIYTWRNKLKLLKKNKIKFINEGISSVKLGKYDTFQNHICRFSLQEKNILLKIDIEGNEYMLFEDDSIYKCLENVNQLIIEFHDLKTRFRSLQKILLKLSNEYEIIHIHGNNYGGSFVLYDFWGQMENDLMVPDVLEISFVRKQEISAADISCELISYPQVNLDFPNNPALKDLPLNFI